ncbi:MAG: hypothetical protein J0L63_16960, partial [Anaerolineae bacterium]|nr:hypothetical protein [Anaerolineae bacterium]
LVTCHYNANVTAANAANPAISPSPNGSSDLEGVRFRACLRRPPSLPPDSLSATTTTTTNTPLGGIIGCFPPSLTTSPLPLLLQKELPPPASVALATSQTIG